MDPLLHSYAKSVHESLEVLPSELQRLVSIVREADAQIANLLREYYRGTLDGNELTALSSRLNEAYKSKSESVSDLVTLFDKKLSVLETSQKEVLANTEGLSERFLRDAVGLREKMDDKCPQPEENTQIPKENINSDSQFDISSAQTETLPQETTVSRSRRRRKQPRNEIVRNPKLRQVDPFPTLMRTTNVSPPKSSSTYASVSAKDIPGKNANVCFCKGPSSEDMVQCDNMNCAIGWYHLACVGLEEIPMETWLCNDCVKRLT